MKYSKLFKSAQLKKITMKNRLVMAPMTTFSGELDGSFSKQEIKMLSARAEDGIGTIITPACYCHKSGQAFEPAKGGNFWRADCFRHAGFKKPGRALVICH